MIEQITDPPHTPFLFISTKGEIFCIRTAYRIRSLTVVRDDKGELEHSVNYLILKILVQTMKYTNSTKLINSIHLQLNIY